MVLLTRPLSQAGNLQSLLENSDLDYVLFPAIEINQMFINFRQDYFLEKMLSDKFYPPKKGYLWSY